MAILLLMGAEMIPKALLDRLMATVPLFDGFAREDVSDFLSQCQRLDCTPGQLVIHEKEPGDTLYVVISGQLEVLRQTPGLGLLHIADIHPGDTFGEMSLLDQAPRSATVRCASACCLIALEARNLVHIPTICLKLYRNLACMMAERLRDSNAAISLMAKAAPATEDGKIAASRSIRRQN